MYGRAKGPSNVVVVFILRERDSVMMNDLDSMWISFEENGQPPRPPYVACWNFQFWHHPPPLHSQLGYNIVQCWSERPSNLCSLDTMCKDVTRRDDDGVMLGSNHCVYFQ